MNTSNERPTQGAHGAVGELAMESGDWRSQTQRQRIVNKILDIYKKHLPFSVYKRQHEFKKIAEMIEEEIYTAATNQSEYSRKICFNMLAIETRLQNPMSGPSIPQTDNLNSRMDELMLLDEMKEQCAELREHGMIAEAKKLEEKLADKIFS